MNAANGKTKNNRHLGKKFYSIQGEEGMETVRQEWDSMSKNRRDLGLHIYPDRGRRSTESTSTSWTPGIS